MNIIENFQAFSEIEVEDACKLAKAIDPQNFQETTVFHHPIEYAEFNPDRPPPSPMGMHFFECGFSRVFFIGSDASNVIMRNCNLDRCQITNSNFKFSDFTKSRLYVSGIASSFDSSDFSDAEFNNADFEGCSFSESYFYQTNIRNSKFMQSEFIASTFRSSRFENVDLVHSNLDYAEFEEVIFSHVAFPYWSTLHITKGLSEIISSQEVYFSTLGGEHCISKEQYLEELLLLRPFFYYKKDFIALANLYILEGEHAKAYHAITEGIEFACKNGRLKLMRYLCRIASVNNFFTRKQMQTLYQLVEKALSNTELSPMQYKNFSQELDWAKRLLIDCPFDQDVIHITIKTSIPHTDYKKLSAALELVDTILETTSPAAVSHIEMRHNSPTEIAVQASGFMPYLLAFFILLDYIFNKSSVYIERIQNIILNYRRLKEDKPEPSEIKLLEKQLSELTEKIEAIEKQAENNNTDIILPGSEDFRCISYTLYTKKDIPKELRTYMTSK